MINHSFFNRFLILALTTSVIFSCNKIDRQDPTLPLVQTNVIFLNAGTGINKVAIDISPSPLTIVGAEIQRGITIEAELNKKVTVIIKDDTAALKASGLIQLPTGLYIVGDATPKMGGAGGNYTVTLEPGELSKQIIITLLDGTKLDPAINYGLAFTILSSVSVTKSVVLQIVAKSKLDGRYQLKGFHSRSIPVLNEPYDEEVHLITTGVNSVKMFWPSLGIDAHPLQAGTTYYADFSTEFLFDLTNNKMARVVNPYNDKATPFTISELSNSRYDPDTKTIFAQYFYNNNTDRMFTDTLVYIGAR